MPLQNRVSPEGEIVAVAARGTVYGNRGGCFHRDDKTLQARAWASRQWICCVLEFKNRRRPLMRPGLFTELFFLDEATALAAGHRPCFECRRDAAERFARLWPGEKRADGRAAAPAMDRVLHAERLDAAGGKRIWRARLGDLPSGVFVRLGDMSLRERAAARPRSGGTLSRTRPLLLRNETAGVSFAVVGARLLAWSFEGYTRAVALDRAREVEVLTPPSIVAAIAAGYRPGLHASADLV